MELEDDVFFADLSRRIALLITDDDDNGKDLPVCFPSVSLQSLSHAMTAPSPFVYEPTMCYDPTTCRRECKGTGVFIPRSSMPRKKNKPGRFASLNTNKSYKQPEKIKRVSLN